ncbi:16S rRNA (guanine(527)-N(7))-methyltransferase RsmG [Clostridium sp. JN-1]|jgi:16S rRNA (guanine527-N7)-methyltransferase|uniref:16S rRNA (guanine(527)-N(7))-methyltransferase RsmG n=1 Tax=Clostridium sp. JN-1 TaxID=2483110 RepID=UPI000F0B2EDF|nr:16S rRNA (guanine(527)-N(7))-methyltransferase RsmG [Clostridium sp. JN-1]
MNYFDIMKDACDDVNINFDEKAYDKFVKYKDMIIEWNKKINLTAITDEDEIIKKHFIDCINIFKFIPLKGAKNVIDIGTGAGFPGIPMKIVKNDLNITLLDSLNKRINFLNAVIDKLELTNINTIHGRAEDYARKQEYREKADAVVSRAVANLTVLSELCIPYVKVGGYFIAMKGPAVVDEIEEAQNAISILGCKVEDIIEVDIKDSDLNHNLVVIKKLKHTNNTYPRKPGIVSKKPLK